MNRDEQIVSDGKLVMKIEMLVNIFVRQKEILEKPQNRNQVILCFGEIFHENFPFHVHINVDGKVIEAHSIMLAVR